MKSKVMKFGDLRPGDMLYIDGTYVRMWIVLEVIELSNRRLKFTFIFNNSRQCCTTNETHHATAPCGPLQVKRR